MDPLTTVSTRRTPQSERATLTQVPNSAGGYVFEVTDIERLRRFLTLGVDGGTYYVSAKDLARENAAVVFRLAETNHAALVFEIVSISVGGRAPRQNPALFALAVAASVGTAEEKANALSYLPAIARTGTHLFIFARYVQQFRGWGRGLRRAMRSWYLTPEVDKVAYQAVKYRQREGWTHRDLLRKVRPKTEERARNDLFGWIVNGSAGEDTPRLIEGYLKAQERGADVPALVAEYGLSWEMLPDEALGDPYVWGALIHRGMPQTALMRQLPRLTRLGVVGQFSELTKVVTAQLADQERLIKARVHPINVLVAQRTYASGRSARGESTWTPVPQITDALDAAFYAAFGAVEPTGKRTLLALDVSGSMTAPIANMPLTCREASAALALVTVNAEQNGSYGVVGFTSNGNGGWRGAGAALTGLNISPRQRLDDAIRAVSGLPFGGTDCALPMTEALRNQWPVDTFVVYTDNETWAGSIHPHQALREYREKSGIDAKLVVVGMTSTGFSIADPQDPGMLDVVGFDSAVPNLIGDFSRGL